MADERFKRPLFNRLKTSFNIRLPPLRARREDVGVLLAHFLKVHFGGSTTLQRIQDPDPRVRPWLSANDVASVARSHLAENVRTLDGLAKKLVNEIGEAGDTRPAIRQFLSDDIEPAGTVPLDAEQAAPETPAFGRHTEEHLVAALERAGWNRKKAAELLGVGRATFYERLNRHPQLRAALAVDDTTLRQRLAACAGDVDRLASELGTSAALLRRRLAPKR